MAPPSPAAAAPPLRPDRRTSPLLPPKPCAGHPPAWRRRAGAGTGTAPGPMSEEGAAWHTAEGWERAARAFAAAWRAAARGPCGCGPAAEGTWCPACCGAAWRWVPPRPGALPAAAAKGHLLLEHLRLPPPPPQPGAGVQRGPAGDQPAAGLAGLAWEEPADEADEAAEEIQGASGALSCALYISYSEVFRVPALQLAAAGPGGSPVQVRVSFRRTRPRRFSPRRGPERPRIRRAGAAQGAPHPAEGTKGRGGPLRRSPANAPSGGPSRESRERRP